MWMTCLSYTFNNIAALGIMMQEAKPLRRMSRDLIDDNRKIVQVMAWYRQATIEILWQSWPRSMSLMASLGHIVWTAVVWIACIAPNLRDNHCLMSAVYVISLRHYMLFFCNGKILCLTSHNYHNTNNKELCVLSAGDEKCNVWYIIMKDCTTLFISQQNYER